MLKKTKKSEKSTKKLGRPEAIKAEDLLNRHQDLKQFLEHNWGRIGWELQRIRKPEHVRTVLKLVPRLESGRPFHQQPAACLLEDGEIKVEKRELDLMRQQYQDAADTERRLWLEYYHSAFEKAGEAAIALNAVISQFERVLSFYPFVVVIVLMARALEVSSSERIANFPVS